MSEHQPRPYASMSDDQLMAMEQDRSLPMDVWTAVEAERGRRAGASAARPPSPSDDDGGVIAGLAELNGLLVPGERLLAFATQRRIFALAHRRTIVAATTGRFIALSRGLLGGYVPFDVRWQDLHDAEIRAGTFGATLTITSLAQEDLASREGGEVPHPFRLQVPRRGRA